VTFPPTSPTGSDTADRLERVGRRLQARRLRLGRARPYAAYGQNSAVGKILEIHQEMPGRIHVVLIRQSVGF
jgi:hypothetical protein